MGRSRIRNRKTADGSGQGGRAKSTHTRSTGLHSTRSPQALHWRVKRMLELYVAGALGPEEGHLVERHVPECAACARDLREISAVAGLLRTLPFAEPSMTSKQMTANVLARVRATSQRESSNTLEVRWWAPLALQTAGFLVSLALVSSTSRFPGYVSRLGIHMLVGQVVIMSLSGLLLAVLWILVTGIRRLYRRRAFGHG